MHFKVDHLQKLKFLEMPLAYLQHFYASALNCQPVGQHYAKGMIYVFQPQRFYKGHK